MLASEKRIALRRKGLIALLGLSIIVLLCGAAIRLSRPTILVGCNWSESDRLGCGEISHQLWDDLLHRFVDSQGNVDYQAWKQSVNDQQRLNDYLSSLSRMDERRPASKSQRLAFWTNAYNAHCRWRVAAEYCRIRRRGSQRSCGSSAATD